MHADRLNHISKQALNAAFIVHSNLGPDLLESAYKACLVHELRKAALDTQTEVAIPMIYDGAKLADVGYRIDILVDNELIIEVKAIEAIAPVHCAQLVSYLKLANRRLGLLINFNVLHLKDGIYRRANGL